MKCVISGLETENKWNNIPVEKVWIDAAKALRTDRPWLTMREAIIEIHKGFNEVVRKKMAEINDNQTKVV